MTAVLIGIAHHHIPAVGGPGQGQEVIHNGEGGTHKGLALDELQPIYAHDLRYRQADLAGEQLLGRAELPGPALGPLDPGPVHLSGKQLGLCQQGAGGAGGIAHLSGHFVGPQPEIGLHRLAQLPGGGTTSATPPWKKLDASVSSSVTVQRPSSRVRASSRAGRPVLILAIGRIGDIARGLLGIDKHPDADII